MNVTVWWVVGKNKNPRRDDTGRDSNSINYFRYFFTTASAFTAGAGST